MTDKDSSLQSRRCRSWRRRWISTAHVGECQRIGARDAAWRPSRWTILWGSAARMAAAIQSLVHVRPPASGGAQDDDRRGRVAVVLLIGGGALWWRLGSGPIMLDLATPWLISAIEQNLGSRYRVQVGGTQLERDAQGHTHCGCATSCCAMPPARRWQSRPRRRSAYPERAC